MGPKDDQCGNVGGVEEATRSSREFDKIAGGWRMVRAVLLHEIVVFVIAHNYFPWILCSPEITIDNDWWGTFLGVILVILLHLRSFWFTMTIETQFRPNKDPILDYIRKRYIVFFANK